MLGLALGVVLLSSAVFWTCMGYQNYEAAFCAIFTLYLAGLLYSIISPRISCFTITFLAVFALFLLGRPLIDVIKVQHLVFGHSAASEFQMMILYAALATFILTTIAIDIIQIVQATNPRFCNQNLSNMRCSQATAWEHAQKKMWEFRTSRACTYLRIASGLLFLITILFALGLDLEKVMFMRGRSYTDYYRLFQTQAPTIIRTLATFAPYAMCMYLACFPKKKMAYLVLGIYAASGISMLMIGQRGEFAFRLVFCLLYFLIRDRLNDDEKWIGRFEKTVIVIAIPVLSLLFDFINYTRSGFQAQESGVLNSILDFIYKQGVSYNVLGHAYDNFGRMEAYAEGHLYTFGPWIDYITHGPFAQILFDAQALPSNNSVELATQSSSFTHAMSYVAHLNYLGGEGYGSSYLLEIYYDFGFGGVIVGNILLAAMLSFMPRWIQYHPLIFFGWLYASTYFYWLPRASALGWAEFIVTPHFWVALLILLAGYVLIKYVYERAYRKLSKDVPCFN